MIYIFPVHLFLRFVVVFALISTIWMCFQTGGSIIIMGVLLCIPLAFIVRRILLIFVGFLRTWV